MLENKKTAAGIHYSRYIMSWVQESIEVDGDVFFNDLFEKWLESEGCTSDEISEIRQMAMAGKFELEKSAKAFLEAKHKKVFERGDEND